MNRFVRIQNLNKVRVLIHHGIDKARHYGLCARQARDIANEGIRLYRAGASVARAMRESDRMARDCFFCSPPDAAL